MTQYFVGPGGSNVNSGLSWALRRLTLTSIETLVAAGDTVYVGPGTYREQILTTTNGTSGAGVITYIGDESGVNTDGIGGVVRVTGSDNDISATRGSCIAIANNFRTFRGFYLDTSSSQCVNITGNNWIVEKCCLLHGVNGINANGASNNTGIARQCIIAFFRTFGVTFTHTSTVDNTGSILQNCIIIGSGINRAVNITRIGGLTIQNNLLQGSTGVGVSTASPTAGQVNNVNNNIIVNCTTGLGALLTTDMTEDYNCLFGNNTDRTNVSTGTHSNNDTPLLAGTLLTLGYFSWLIGSPSAASLLGSITGTGVPAIDLYGTTRVATSSWGAIQYIAGQRLVDAGQSRNRQQ